MSHGLPITRTPNYSLARYYLPETMPLVFCAACLIVALESSRPLRVAFCEIVDSYRLPDVKKTFNILRKEAARQHRHRAAIN
jgi:hypothetical protein